MSLYLQYRIARKAAFRASVVAKASYGHLVAAIAAGEVKLDINYQGFIVTTIWNAKSVAWRPRPLYAFHVLYTTEFEEVPLPSKPANAETCVLQYVQAHKDETDAWSAVSAAYERLVAAYLRQELLPAEMALITPADYSTGYVEFATDPATARVYEVKPPKR